MERDELIQLVGIDAAEDAYWHFVRLRGSEEDVCGMENSVYDYAMSGIGESFDPPLTLAECEEISTVVYERAWELVGVKES